MHENGQLHACGGQSAWDCSKKWSSLVCVAKVAAPQPCCAPALLRPTPVVR